MILFNGHGNAYTMHYIENLQKFARNSYVKIAFVEN